MLNYSSYQKHFSERKLRSKLFSQSWYRLSEQSIPFL